MTARSDIVDARRPGGFLLDAPSWRVETLKYGSAMLVVAATVAATAIAIGHEPQTEDASEVDTAVVIDLPPTDASSNPTSDAMDGPPQTPVDASAAPQPVQPPKIETKPIEPSEPQQKAEAPPVPPPPVPPDPPAVIDERKEAKTPPPPAVTAPTSAPQEEHAPAGADTPVENQSDQDAEDRPHASAHAITQWQRSLMRRLELAKRTFARETQVSGTVKIAFEIDDHGALLSEHIAQSSGSTTLDRTAAALVRQAAPFPAPPAGATHREMSFIVPILFRH